MPRFCHEQFPSNPALVIEFLPPWLGNTTIQIPWMEGVHMTNLRRSTDGPEKNEIFRVFCGSISLLFGCEIISAPTLSFLVRSNFDDHISELTSSDFPHYWVDKPAHVMN